MLDFSTRRRPLFLTALFLSISIVFSIVLAGASTVQAASTLESSQLLVGGLI